jgi:hypothetical protein
MPTICRDYDLFFAHVPKTGGTFVSEILTKYLGGKPRNPKHDTFRQAQVEDPPSIRVFTVREPLSWYRSYWAYARSSMRHRDAWPIWEAPEVRHPTRPLDERCGHRDFSRFVGNILETFPDGFVRSMYCDYLNGSTHVLRHEHLRDDLERLLEIVDYIKPSVVRDVPSVGVTENRWTQRATLPKRLVAQLREVDNLDGLVMPFVGATS